MPKRNSVKKIITPFDLQGSEGDEAYIVFKPPTMNEAQELRLVQDDINSKIQRALSDYAEENNKTVSELSEADKQLAFDKAGLTDSLMNKANETLAGFILEWNWVDDDGNPLPQPIENSKILGSLYPKEYNYVMSLISGQGDNDPKN